MATARRWPALVLLTATLASVSVALDLEGPVRSVIVLSFILVCPGLAVVGSLRLEDRLAEGVLAVAVSVALAALASGVLMYGRWWSPPRVLAILVLITLVGAALELRTPTAARS